MKNIGVKARQLRRDQTDAEQKLWARLRDRQICDAKFRRQHPIGPFIADFCCPQRKLVVELDGGQHALRSQRIGNGVGSWKGRVIGCSAFGTMTCWGTLLAYLNE